MGTHVAVRWEHRRRTEDAIEELQRAGIPVVALETVPTAPYAHAFSFPPAGCALLLGNERHGIAPELLARRGAFAHTLRPKDAACRLQSAVRPSALCQSRPPRPHAYSSCAHQHHVVAEDADAAPPPSRCDAIVRLPCRGVKNSLNVAVAFGMCAHEVARQWEAAA